MPLRDTVTENNFCVMNSAKALWRTRHGRGAEVHNNLQWLDSRFRGNDTPGGNYGLGRNKRINDLCAAGH